ncbi:MAG TPA: YoaK family protein [Polyangiales bacterium]|nr:YoaK family protein [Polyangiales bacterium]
MFRHQGPGRSDRQNSILAAYLSIVAGFVNSAAFVLIGTFTSHVTGNVGRLANDIATQQLYAALAALSMIVSFFVGAFVASMTVESNLAGRTPIAYGLALSFEAALLVTFIVLTRLHGASAPLHELEESVLCMAMGAQSSLVTRLSGAVVRTTHLTGAESQHECDAC